MKKKLIAGLVVVIVAIGGYIGYAKYEQYKFIASVTSHVKNTSLHLMNALRYETETDTKISLQELFNIYEVDIAVIEKGILEVQKLSTPSNKDIADPILTYLTCSQELLRTLLSKNRKLLAARNAGDLLGTTAEKVKASNFNNHDDAMRAYKEAKSAYLTAQRENEQSIPVVVLSIANLKRAYDKVLGVVPATVLVDPSIIEAVAKRNAKAG